MSKKPNIEKSDKSKRPNFINNLSNLAFFIFKAKLIFILLE